MPQICDTLPFLSTGAKYTSHISVGLFVIDRVFWREPADKSPGFPLKDQEFDDLSYKIIQSSRFRVFVGQAFQPA